MRLNKRKYTETEGSLSQVIILENLHWGKRTACNERKMKQAEQEKNNDPSHWLRIKRDNIVPLIFTIIPLGSKGKSSCPFHRWVVQGQPDWQGPSLDHNWVSGLLCRAFRPSSLGCRVSSPSTFSQKADLYESDISHSPSSMGPSLLLALSLASSITGTKTVLT